MPIIDNAELFGTLRDRLIFLMKDRGLWDGKRPNLIPLAEGLNVSTAALSRYLSGHRNPDPAYIASLASYFNVSTDWLLGLTDDSKRHTLDDSPKMPELPEDETERITALYAKASEKDRQIINVILSKYKG